MSHVTSIVILCSHLLLRLLSCLIPSGLQTDFFFANFHVSHPPCKISGSHGGKYEDSCQLGYYIVKFQRYLLPPSSGRPDDGGSNYLWNIGELLPDYTAQKLIKHPSSNPSWFSHPNGIGWQRHSTKIANRSFEDVGKFRYLETTVTDQNCMPKDIKSRLNSGNAC
jgi:hypothetical protein